MGKCIITKLNASSGDSGLIHMDGFKVNYSSSNTALGVWWNSANGAVVSMNNSSVNWTQTSSFQTKDFSIPDGTVLEVRTKTNVRQFAIFREAFDCNTLKYCPLLYLTAKSHLGIVGELSVIFESNHLIREIDAAGSSITGSLDDLAAACAPDKSNADTLLFNGNGKVTYKVNGVDTVIPNNVAKTVNFDGAGGYTIS